MKNQLKGFPTVFSFTFARHVKGKGYLAVTVVLALLCFLLPLVIMPLIELGGGEDGTEVTADVREVYVCDLDGSFLPFDFLNASAPEGLNRIEYKDGGSTAEQAQALALEVSGKSLVMILERIDGDYNADIILPDHSELSYDDMYAFENLINASFPYILLVKSGVSTEQLAAMTAEAESIAVETDDGDAADPMDGMREILSFVLPYINIMLLYFMVLIYGQGVATGAIMEKTSKLMDTMLVSVKPSAMLLGKVLATALSGVLQLFIWIAALALGFVGGTLAVKQINPETDMLIIRFLESLGPITGLFTPGGVIAALLLLLSGFLLYCSLAAIGGALASKQEDLSSTNVLFTMVLVISFFATLFSGALEGSTASWLNWFPFTAILITPSGALLGTVSLAEAIASLLIVLATSFVIILIAGRIYRLTALYRGKPFSPKQIIFLIKGK